jgi:predicted Zn-dependent peptidase
VGEPADQFRKNAEYFRTLWLAACGHSLVEPAPPPPGTTAVPLRGKLDNGLQSAVQYFPDRRQFCHGMLLIKTGADHDPAGKEGVAHFLEHVLMDPATLNEIKKRGGEASLATRGNTIVVDLTMPSQEGTFMIDTLKQIAVNRTLSPDLVERERKRILNEIGIQNDNPEKRLHREGIARMYSSPAVVASNLGTRENVRALTIGDMSDYLNRYFNASNMVLVAQVPNRDDVARAREYIRQTFADVPAGAPAEPAAFEYTPYEQRNNHGTEQVYFSYNMNVDKPGAANFYAHSVYVHYLQLLTERDVIHSGSLYQAEVEGIHESGKISTVMVFGNALPEDAGEIGRKFAEMIGGTARGIDPEAFAIAKQRAMREFLGGENEWLWAKSRRSMACALAFEDRSESYYDNFQGFEKVSPEDLMAFARDKVLGQKPSVMADGDSSLLPGQDDFEAMMHAAARPDAVKPGFSGEFKPATA